MLNPFSFLLARTLAQREGVDDSRANRLALVMGMTGLNPAMGAVVAQQSARREVSSAQTATESAELNDAVNSLRRAVADMQKTGESLEMCVVDFPPDFGTKNKAGIQKELKELGFLQATVEVAPDDLNQGKIISVDVTGQTLKGQDLDNLKLTRCVPFKVIVSSGPAVG